MRKRKAGIGVATVVTSLAVPAGVFAQESGTANTAVVSAMTDVSNDMIATANSIIPIALGVVGLAIVVVFGIRIFKRITSKG